ncbi:UNC93-like protein 1 [Selaginella moellendorffii]|nr:UNC93-like protein 1 [Selaginella moellendorffii]|eukprot:XP_002982929.2 UNC93-like protein 1 [Selaginella moellendorffii]
MALWRTGGGAMALLPRLRTPMGQVILVGAVCFCCPGMFSALTGMGGGGQVDPHAANRALTALYAAFAIFGLLGGGFNNILGPRITVLVGSVFYALYVASFLRYNHSHDERLVVLAGGLLGFGAGLLWAGQGSILMSYPPERDKGLYISIFWSVFNMGGVVGGLIPFFLNFSRDRSSSHSVNDTTYIAFIVVMLCGSILSLKLVQPDQVAREDGTQVISALHTDVATECWEILKLFRDPRMLAFVPACIASNFFYTYQFNNVNGLLFDVRTRGLNNVVYWSAQMLGSVLAGRVLDKSSPSSRSRAHLGILLVAAASTLIWAAAFVNQTNYSRRRLPHGVPLDFTDGFQFLGPFVLYSCFGLLDAMFQTLCYWVMGEMSGEVQTLSRYGGFYKGLQSAGAAVAWQLDASEMALMPQLCLNWILMSLSFPLLWIMVRDFKDERHHRKEDKEHLFLLDSSSTNSED